MQIYKGLDIGTAKPSGAEKDKVPHHLIDMLEIEEPLNVYKYLDLAENAVREIRARGKIPVFAGGTGLYLRALLYGLDPLPADTALRQEIDLEFSTPEGFEKLKTIMRKESPEDLERWKDNKRKLLRSYEVFRLAGVSMSELQKTWKMSVRDDALVWRLEWDRADLRARIVERTDAMLRAGWLDEADALIKRGLLYTPTARQALGYGIIGEFLNGVISSSEMREKIITATWQYARRQDTWFRNKHPEAKRVPMPLDAVSFMSGIEILPLHLRLRD